MISGRSFPFLPALVAMTVSCSPVVPPCSPMTCPAGCCTEAGVCESGSQSGACGARGNVCKRCLVAEACVQAVCTVQNGVGGGFAGGGSAAGGSAAGGLTAGGSTAGGSTAGGSAAGGSTAGGSASVRTRVFLTTGRTQGDMQPLDHSAPGGLAAADSFCNAWADARFLNGTWRAFLSTGTESAVNRTIGSGPWVSLDGGIVFLNRAALGLGLNGASVITFDSGEVPGRTSFWTGTTANGQPSSARCDDWTSRLTSGTRGESDGGTVTWDDRSLSECQRSLSLLCFEQEVAPLRMSPRPASPKRLFVTSLKFTGNLGGLSGADTSCQNVATARGLGGRWRAVLGTSTVEPSQRPLSEGPYTLLDGGVLFRNRASLQVSLVPSFTSVVTDELGVVPPVGDGAFWSGSSAFSKGGNCMNWMTAAPNVTGGAGSSQRNSQFSLRQFENLCELQSGRLLCVED
jgi:hypothetical protein